MVKETEKVMNNEEIQALMAKLQEAGLTPEDIADGILWPLFRDGKMSKEDLGTLCSSIGLELAEDFDKDEGPAAEDGEGVTKEEAEDLKEIEPGESKEEFKEKVEEAKEEDKAETPAAEEDKKDEEVEEKSEDEEWDEVKKNIFKL
jgi:hypothetical protein